MWGPLIGAGVKLYGHLKDKNNQYKEQCAVEREEQLRHINLMVEKHHATLSEKRRSSITVDDYGTMDQDLWTTEKDYFIKRVITPEYQNATLYVQPEEIHSMIDHILDKDQ